MTQETVRKKIKVGVLGASGYTGADLVRLLSVHPAVEIVALTAKSNAGKAYKSIYPQCAHLDLPFVTNTVEQDFSKCHVVFCGMPHGLSHDLVKNLPKNIKVIDLSADFRLRDTSVYEAWYKVKHTAPDLQKEAVYGLPEHNRGRIRAARLIACPGCYPTATLLSLLPLVKGGVIEPYDIIIDAKSGVSGAGRKVVQGTLYCEVAERMSPYAVASHRHAPEIEQELSAASGKKDIVVNFTPHLVPLNRGELVTIYVRHAPHKNHDAVKEALISAYKSEKFVNVIDDIPATSMVRGSNFAVINATKDRLPDRSIIVAAIDNLVKGSSGQAIQNMNIAFGLPETLGLLQNPLFP